MPRRTLYPEGKAQLNAVLPTSLKDAIDNAADSRHIPTSQLVRGILEAWLKDHEAVTA